ncbi:hypothetical protein V8E52_010615 [Russula decolorans]
MCQRDNPLVTPVHRFIDQKSSPKIPLLYRAQTPQRMEELNTGSTAAILLDPSSTSSLAPSSPTWSLAPSLPTSSLAPSSPTWSLSTSLPTWSLAPSPFASLSLAPSPGPSTPPPLPNAPFCSPPNPPSPGPSTPPPLPNSAFPRLPNSAVPPQLAPQAYLHVYRPPSIPLPFIPPAPLTPGVCIHPALAAPSLLYDMRSQPSHSNPRLSPAVLTTPASHPPLPSLALRVSDLPWLFTALPDAEHSPGNAIVTVQDVLLAIYIHLRVVVKFDEYEAMSKSRRAEIFRAFESRVRTDSIRRGNWLQRVDLLGGHFCAQGLVRAQSEDNVWVVALVGV